MPMELILTDLIDRVISILRGNPPDIYGLPSDTSYNIIMDLSLPKRHVKIDMLTYALWAAQTSKIGSQIAETKVGLGVFINEQIIKDVLECQINESALEKLYVEHNIDLLGTKCPCPTPCPHSRKFLGAPCRKMIERHMLLKQITIVDVALTISKMMLP